MVLTNLLMVLLGFILSMLGVIIAIHSSHFELGLILLVGGILSLFEGLPRRDNG